ncbi:UDP-3-O-(3-hydroxymyristoyl)glucosamine N-acyltransferase [soil metagenome]
MSAILGSPTTINQILQRLGPLVTSTHGLLANASATGTGITIHSVNSPDFAGPGQVGFVTQPKYLEKALASTASVLCFPEKSKNVVVARIESGGTPRAYFFSKEPELAMRETIQSFFQTTPYINQDFETPVHPTAVIHPEAQLGRGVRIGPFAVISKHVVIGDEAVVGAHTVIESRSKIGARTVLHPFVYIGPSCDVGADCEINPHTVIGKEGFGYAHDTKNNHYRIPHTGRVIIGDRVHLGSSVTVDRGTFADTRIEAGAILDNRIQISHNAVIGENAIITAGFVIAGSSKVGRNFLTGGNTAVTGHIELCDNVQLAALSVVRKNITKPGAYGGNPLMPMRDYMRFLAAQMKLPLLVKKFKGDLGDDAADESDATSNEPTS